MDKRADDELLTVKQGAALLQVSTDAMYRMINEGVLPARRLSPRRTRLLRSEVEAALRPVVVKRNPLPRQLAAPVTGAAAAPTVRRRRAARVQRRDGYADLLLARP